MFYDMLNFFIGGVYMKILNLDLDLVSSVSLESITTNEVEINLGKCINDKIYSKILIDKSIIDDLREGKNEGFGLSGVYTPIIDKKGVDYKGSNILFTSVYSMEDGKLSLYGETKLRGAKESLDKIKIIAGGYATDLSGNEILNLVLKVPSDCYYGLACEDDVMYDSNDNMVLFNSVLSKPLHRNKVSNRGTNMEVLTLSNVLDKANILPPRGVYNKTLYRHFKGKWYLVEGVGNYVDTDKTLVSYRAMYGDCSLYFRDKNVFTSENEKKNEYPLQDYRFMTIKELEHCLGATSEEFMQVLTEYNNLINEHPFILGL